MAGDASLPQSDALQLNNNIKELVKAAYLMGRNPKAHRILKLLSARPMYTRELLRALGNRRADYERSYTLRLMAELERLGVIEREWILRGERWVKMNRLTPLGKLLLELLDSES